jgi:hypothetical protein
MGLRRDLRLWDGLYAEQVFPCRQGGLGLIDSLGELRRFPPPQLRESLLSLPIDRRLDDGTALFRRLGDLIEQSCRAE